MVSLLFGIESTVFSLVCQKAQTRLCSLSYCPSVSSVLCFLAPEFPIALEPFWTFVYFFLLTCAFHSSASCSPLSLKLCSPPETQFLCHPKWEDFAASLSSSWSLQHFEPLSWHLPCWLPVYLSVSFTEQQKKVRLGTSVSVQRKFVDASSHLLRWKDSFAGSWQACEISSDFGGYR